MKTLTVPAYAKINLSLDVLGKQESGYHDLKMVMQSVSLCDRVTLTLDEAETLTLSTNLGRPGLCPAYGKKRGTSLHPD